MCLLESAFTRSVSVSPEEYAKLDLMGCGPRDASIFSKLGLTADTVYTSVVEALEVYTVFYVNVDSRS